MAEHSDFQLDFTSKTNKGCQRYYIDSSLVEIWQPRHQRRKVYTAFEYNLTPCWDASVISLHRLVLFQAGIFCGAEGVNAHLGRG